MKTDTLVNLSIKLVTLAIIVAPLIVSYFLSGSLQEFVTPKIEVTPPNPKFEIISVEFKELSGGQYVLLANISNTGSMTFGVEELKGNISLPFQGDVAEFLLANTLVLIPGDAGDLTINVQPSDGHSTALKEAIDKDEAIGMRGNALLVLSSVELPFTFSVSLKPSEMMGYGKS